MRVLTVYRNLIFIIRKLIGFVIGFGRFILFKKNSGVRSKPAMEWQILVDCLILVDWFVSFVEWGAYEVRWFGWLVLVDELIDIGRLIDGFR